MRHDNPQPVHEWLDNLTPADVYHGRAAQIVNVRNWVKDPTLGNSRRMNMRLESLRDDRMGYDAI